jgi:serine/threonine-protein kinase
VAEFSDVVAELKRRRVIRALVVWGVVAFAVLQVYEPLMHGLHLPEWTLSFVVLALGLGFPVTAALAWVFDLKAGGIERTPPVAEEAPATSTSSPTRRLRLALLLLGLGAAAAAPGLVYFFARPGGIRVALLLLGLGAAVAALGLGYLLIGPGGVRRAREERSGLPAAPTVPSIAVLPFVNVSSDKEQEYFSDGIAEEILNALAQVDGLRVIGRTSSFSMKGKNEDLRTIGQRLGAAHLLEGSVRKSGTRVRITAQLVEASGGSHLWSQEFDRVLTDVFAVQEEIARAVVAALKLTLFPETRQEQRTISPEAHDPYLLGLAFLARGSVDAYGRAVRALRKSVELDPGYAQAWAALARARYWAADQDPAGNPDVEWPKALAAAERAIALAPLLADGYVARGLLRENALQDWPGARADFERARSLNPRSPEILLEFATLLAALGKLPEAIAAAKEAAALDPLAADIPSMLSSFYLGARQLGLAEAAAAQALEVSPEHGRAARNLGFALLLQGRLPEARAAFHGSSPELYVRMGDVMVDHALGLAAESQRALDGILALPYIRLGSYQVAQIFAWRGEAERAFEWLGYAVEQHDAGLIYLKYDPLLAGLRDDPRYAGMLRKLKLPVD